MTDGPDGPCADCGGACCSFRTMRICYRSFDDEHQADPESALEETVKPEQLLLDDGSAPDMEWRVGRIDGEAHLLFECNHLDGGLCGVYEDRPEMCRVFECEALRGEATVEEMLEEAARPDGELESMETTDVTDEVNAILEGAGP